MEQVPTKKKPYLIIGGGRLAKHLAYYLQLLDIPFNQWKRKDRSKLEKLSSNSNKILLAISDDSIIPVAKKFPDKLVIHFSGVLTTKFAESAHPLFTFSNTSPKRSNNFMVSFLAAREGVVVATNMAKKVTTLNSK